MTIDEIRTRAAPYPTELLADQHSALVLFGAAFLGVNDAIHLEMAGIPEVSVVDVDGARLGIMRALYPDPWEFIAEDAFAFAERQRDAGVRYDLVSADPFTGLMPQCRESLPTFLQLARRTMVLGVEHGLPFESPAGWDCTRVERSDIADWIVLEPA